MDQAEMLALLDKRDADKKAASEAEQAQATARQLEMKAAIDAERKKWETEAKALRRRGSYQAGEGAEQSETNPDELKAVASFIKTGDQGALNEFKASNATDMNIGTPADGGYAVPTGHYRGIFAKCGESRLAEKLGVTMVPGIGTTINVPVEDGTANEFVATAEANDFDLDAPVLGQLQMTYVKYTKYIKLSVELLRDEDSKLMAFIENYVGRAMAATHNKLLIAALAAGATATSLGTASTMTTAPIAALPYSLLDCYGDNAKWLMKNSTLGAIRSLTGNPFQFVNTPTGGENQIGGYPVFTSEFVSTPAASAVSAFFGDFSYVGLREADGMQFLRDPYSLALKGQIVLWYYFSAVYKVLQPEAILKATHTSA